MVTTSILLLDFSRKASCRKYDAFASQSELLVIETGKCVLFVRNEPPILLEGGTIAFINQDIPQK